MLEMMLIMISDNQKEIIKVSNLQNDTCINSTSSGFLYTHARLNDNTQKTLQNSSFLFALIELLEKKGLITIDEIDEKKKEVAQRLLQKFSESGLGLLYQEPEMEKYTFNKTSDVPCAEKIRSCKAVCCKLPFALSRQDVDEGIVRWEFGRPYVIAHNEDGYCVHLDKNTYRCTVHENRPVPCRGFDCRDSKRWNIWKDFYEGSLNPDLEKCIEQAIEKFYSF